ncbi:MAG TPA: lysophospholipid acyltransferase family protein [Geobacteraceae bacterium]
MKDLLRALKNRFAGNLLPRLIYVVVRCLYASLRVRIVGGDVPQAFHDRGVGVINVFWHARLLMIPFAYTGKGIRVLISSHSDGEVIANTMKYFGFGLVRGSSSKKGDRALREMVQLARDNQDLAITPDGPRGPAEVVKLGVAQLARLTGRPVVPIAFSSSRAKRFSSWDRFLLPYPFSRGVLLWGEPLFWREGEELEAFRLRIEQALRETTARADALVGLKA